MAFFFIYISEAHPHDPEGTPEPENVAEGISIDEHESFQQRLDAAETCQTDLDLSMPILVDTLSGYAENAYGAWPDRIYIIGKDGRIAYRGDPGPPGFNAEEMGERLRAVLDAPPAVQSEPAEVPSPTPERPLRFR